MGDHMEKLVLCMGILGAFGIILALGMQGLGHVPVKQAPGSMLAPVAGEQDLNIPFQNRILGRLGSSLVRPANSKDTYDCGEHAVACYHIANPITFEEEVLGIIDGACYWSMFSCDYDSNDDLRRCKDRYDDPWHLRGVNARSLENCYG